MATCASCSREVQDTHRGLCGACYKRWRKWNETPNVACEWCGREYFDPAPRQHTLCSRPCYRAWKIGRTNSNEPIAARNRPPVDADGKVVLKCVHCGASFRVRPYELKRHPRYCSLACNAAVKIIPRIQLTCERCNKQFRFLPGRLRWGFGRFCSRKCFKTARKENKLPREPDRGRAYRRFRDQLLSQVDHCAECGRQENLVVHHRIRTRERPDLLFALENIQVLCRGCHTRRHASQGHLRVPKQSEQRA